MATTDRQEGATHDRGRPTPGSRRSLSPANPMSGWLALFQILLLLGIPIMLLLLARLVLQKFFPALGY